MNSGHLLLAAVALFAFACRAAPTDPDALAAASADFARRLQAVEARIDAEQGPRRGLELRRLARAHEALASWELLVVAERAAPGVGDPRQMSRCRGRLDAAISALEQ